MVSTRPIKSRTIQPNVRHCIYLQPKHKAKKLAETTHSSAWEPNIFQDKKYISSVTINKYGCFVTLCIKLTASGNNNVINVPTVFTT